MKLHLALKDIFGNKRFALFFVLNLAIGLVGYSALDAFKNSFQKSMSDSSRVLMTGDIEISARRAFTDDELTKADKVLAPYILDKNHQISMFSMVASKSSSRLVQIKAIEKSHPFYGKIFLEDDAHKVSNNLQDIQNNKFTAWSYPEILTQLKVSLGDEIKIGDKMVKLTHTVKEDTSMGFGGMVIAPRIYLSMDTVRDLGLIKKGSSVWHTHLYKLNDKADSKKLAQQINELLDDPGVRVHSHIDASQQTGRILRYLNDYLGLVAIAALFLSFIGAAYLFRSYLARKVKEVAILKSLGMTPVGSVEVILWQLVIFSIIASVLSYLLSLFLLPVLPRLFADFLPIDIKITVSGETFGTLLLISLLGSIGISVPFLAKMKRLKAAMLFQEGALPTIDLRWKDLLLYLPAVVSAWLLAVWQANSILVGSVFMLGFVLSAVLIAVFSLSLVGLLKLFFVTQDLPQKLAFMQLSRNKLNTVACFLAIGLGSLLLNLIPQVKAGLEMEIAAPEESKLPSLFLFDIQDDQVATLKQKIHSEKLSMNQISPMVRARLEKVNGETFKKQDSFAESQTREQARANQQRNRGYNLSYRSHLSDTEEVIEGSPILENYNADKQQYPSISLEFRFADRLGLKIGDILTFDIQGTEIEGKVVNLRKVKWTSFQPNFFIQFQPGVLEEAPKTYVASIPSHKSLNVTGLQSKLVEDFPNISIVNVSRVVEKVLSVVESMSWILSYMAWLTLFAGFVVLYSIAEFQVRLRSRDTALLKILGAEFSDIRKSIFWEFGVLGLLASFLGALIAILFSWAFSAFLFEGAWAFNMQIPVVSIVAITALTLILSFAATNKNLKKKPIAFVS